MKDDYKDIEKLQRLIDKGIPKKPIVEYGYYDKCRICGNSLHDRFNVNYCGHCGQKIDRR